MLLNGKLTGSDGQALTDCAQNQHQLQLLVTVHLYQQTLQSDRVSNAFIFKVDGRGVTIIPLEPWALKQNALILKCIEQTR
jgi:hypothetical protein